MGGGGCKTPPSRVSSEGGVVVGRKGGGGCENLSSRISSEGEACGGCGGCETHVSRVSSEWWVVVDVKPLLLAFRAREGL